MYGHIVLASTKKGFIPNAIKWFTKSLFSHSLVTIPDMLYTPMCMEALANGVDVSRFDSGYIINLDQGYEVWRLKIVQEVKDKSIIDMTNNLEVGYGYLEYPWFIWRKICLWFGKDIKSQNNWNTDGMICSQLCVAYLNACGLGHIFKEYGRGSIAPQDLQDIFKLNPDLFELIEIVRL